MLDRKLEVLSETAHADFRCFISAEPPPMPFMKILPESLLQSCVKVANEAPADLKSNLRRAWSNFSEERIEANAKPTEFKATLFGLCFFHALTLGRIKFGTTGWSRKYSFNTGDLVICADVLGARSAPPFHRRRCRTRPPCTRGPRERMRRRDRRWMRLSAKR